MMTTIRQDMPLLARHEGVWDGTYAYFNASNEQVDEHESRLICRFPEEGAPYDQTNYYRWADGRTETREFPATFHNKRVWWDNELIKGSAWEVGDDDYTRSVMLYWQRQGDPSLYLYEMIQIADDGETRCRTWHWIRSGRLETRTAIQERRVAHDWHKISEKMKAGEWT